MRKPERLWLSLLIGLLCVPWFSFAAVVQPTKVNSADGLSSHLWLQTGKYTVKSGDTLWDISQKLGVTVADLIANNDVTNPHFLQIGETLIYHADLFGTSAKTTTPIAQPLNLSGRSEKPSFLPTNSKVMFCTLTAYTAGYESTGKRPGDKEYGVTSTGHFARQGLTVAVDPRVIPYGTKLFIPGIGFRVADDTGGAIIGNHIDVYYTSEHVAEEFGVKHDIPVYILPNWYQLPDSY